MKTNQLAATLCLCTAAIAAVSTPDASAAAISAVSYTHLTLPTIYSV